MYMAKMKCLNSYIKKHGRHFTIELAKEVMCFKWSPEEVQKTSQKMVYYNVTESTLGDMVFLTNYIYYYYDKARNKTWCVSEMLSIVGDVFLEGHAFSSWIDTMIEENKDFDFKRFI